MKCNVINNHVKYQAVSSNEMMKFVLFVDGILMMCIVVYSFVSVLLFNVNEMCVWSIIY